MKYLSERLGAVEDEIHLTNRFIRKLLSHTVGMFLNMLLGREALQFEGLVEI